MNSITHALSHNFHADVASLAHTAAASSSSPGVSSSNPADPNSNEALTSESTFLHLLVAQIKNQDPLNPTDPTQFVGQLTQYSELEQLIQINTGVKGINNSGTPTP